jgi:hypothetical protein
VIAAVDAVRAVMVRVRVVADVVDINKVL